MNDIVIVSYDCSELADFFKKCNEDIKNFISLKNINITVDCNHNLDRDTIHANISQYHNNYIVSIFAHGKDDKIVDNEENILISIDDAKIYYNNAIVYSGACLSANELGLIMHSHNCKLFYGYTKKYYLSPYCNDTFVQLNNFALKQLLQDIDIEPVALCKKIDEFFDNQMEYFSSHEPTTALLLNPLIMHNKESFVIYKNREIYPRH
jgi:hypothetical protein